MGIFRSEDIYLWKVSMTKDSAYESMKGLGRLSWISFIDLNTNTQVFELPFSNELKRWNESLKNIDNIKEVCDRLQVSLKIPSTLNEYMIAKEGLKEDFQVSEHRLLDLIEKEVKEYDEFLSNQNKSLKEIKEDFNMLKEYREALIHAQDYLFAFPKK